MSDIDELKKRITRLEQVVGIGENRDSSIEEKRNSANYSHNYENNIASNLPPPPPMPSMARLEKNGYLKSSGIKDLESYIGKRWAPILGMLLLLIGVSFFLKYAFETNLIGVMGRVILGLIAGLILVVLGEYLRSKVEKYSWIISGGGLSLFYLSIYGAHRFYNLIQNDLAFAFMIVVTAFGAVLATRYNALPLAGFAIFGGFLTPVLIPSAEPNLISLFTYIAILNAGILTLGITRNWRSLSLLGLVGSGLWAIYWLLIEYADIQLYTMIFFLTIFFSEFLIATIAGNILSSEKSTKDDLGLLTVNAAGYFSLMYMLILDNFDQYLGLFTTLMAAIYVVFAASALSAKSDDKNLVFFLLGIALIFITLIFPIQFNGHWVTIAWALEAAVLAYIGTRLHLSDVRLAAYPVLLISIGHVFMIFRTVILDPNYTLLINERILTFFVVIGSIILVSILMRDKWEILSPTEKTLNSYLPVIWNLLLLYVLTTEIVNYFQNKIYIQRGSNPGGSFYNSPAAREIQISSLSISNMQNTVITIFWSVYASIALAYGMLVNNKSARIGALVLFGATLLKVVLLDVWQLPLLYRFIAFTVLAILILIGGYFYNKRKSDDED